MESQAPPRFALIAEGPSDHVVLTHFLAAYFKNPDIITNPLQPPSAQIPGGWTEVLRYCSSPRLERAFVDNDFIVIQIDTDVCEEAGFDVPRRDPDGKELTPDALADRVTDLLISRLPPDVYAKFKDRIIFAISVDSIECWLLPLYYHNDMRSKTTNCLVSLNQALSKYDKFSIDKNHKDAKYHEKIMHSKKCGRRKTLESIAGENPSLTRFIRRLDDHFPASRLLPATPVTPAP